MKLKKADVMALVGKNVRVTFFDGKEVEGKLGYTSAFCEKEGWRNPDYFTVLNWDFKVSHLKKITVLN